MTPTVGIVGMGYVGRAVRRCLAARGITPARYDKEPPTYFGEMPLSSYGTRREWVQGCDIVFVCVPTPEGKDGRLDTSAVEEVLGWLSADLIVIRSTMPEDWEDAKRPFTTDWPPKDLNVVYQPEFIGESVFAPWREEEDCKLVVAGGDRAQEVIDFWKPLLGPEVRYVAMDWRTAVEIKFAVNCHGAVKVAWWNEFLGKCGDADAVRNAVMSVPWIHPYHTLPLGPVGGKCFPKDLKHWVSVHGGEIGRAVVAGMNTGRRK